MDLSLEIVQIEVSSDIRWKPVISSIWAFIEPNFINKKICLTYRNSAFCIIYSVNCHDTACISDVKLVPWAPPLYMSTMLLSTVCNEFIRVVIFLCSRVQLITVYKAIVITCGEQLLISNVHLETSQGSFGGGSYYLHKTRFLGHKIINVNLATSVGDKCCFIFRVYL